MVLSVARGAAWTESIERVANARLVYDCSIFAIVQGDLYISLKYSRNLL